MTTPAGPPIRLLTHSERKKRRRTIVAAVVIGSSFAITLTFLALSIATRPNANVNLGSGAFRVGFAYNLNKRINRDHYPLLFQDLRNKEIDVFVSHTGKDFLTGWHAIEAHAPDAPRTCQLAWNGTAYRDPCNGAVYPASGTGLRRFQVNVVDGVIYVNFRAVETK